MTRWLLSHDSPRPSPLLERALRHPDGAGVRFLGAALRQPTNLRRLADLVHSAGSPEPRRPEEIPRLVVLDPADLPADGEIPAAPEIARHARDLAVGGEAMDVTLEVLDWARRIADLGVGLVYAPDLSALPSDLGESAGDASAAWLEAIHAAGLIAAPGPLAPATLRADEGSQRWSVVGGLLAHGAEVLRLGGGTGEKEEADEAEENALGPEELDELRREKSVDAVLVGSGRGADLVELGRAELPEPAGAYTEADRRVDRLRLEWLL